MQRLNEEQAEEIIEQLGISLDSFKTFAGLLQGIRSCEKMKASDFPEYIDVPQGWSREIHRWYDLAVQEYNNRELAIPLYVRELSDALRIDFGMEVGKENSLFIDQQSELWIHGTMGSPALDGYRPIGFLHTHPQQPDDNFSGFADTTDWMLFSSGDLAFILRHNLTGTRMPSFWVSTQWGFGLFIITQDTIEKIEKLKEGKLKKNDEVVTVQDVIKGFVGEAFRSPHAPASLQRAKNWGIVYYSSDENGNLRKH